MWTEQADACIKSDIGLTVNSDVFIDQVAESHLTQLSLQLHKQATTLSFEWAYLGVWLIVCI